MSRENVNNTDNWNITYNTIGAKWNKQGSQQAAMASSYTHIDQKCLQQTNLSYIFYFSLATVLAGKSFKL